MEGPGGLVLLPIAALSVMLLLAWFRWGNGSLSFKLKALVCYLAVAALPWGFAVLMRFPSPPHFLLAYALLGSVLMTLLIGFALPPISRKVLTRLLQSR